MGVLGRGLGRLQQIAQKQNSQKVKFEKKKSQKAAHAGATARNEGGIEEVPDIVTGRHPRLQPRQDRRRGASPRSSTYHSS